MAFRVTRKVYKQGDSVVVTLPRVWVEATGLRIGSKVEMSFESPSDPLIIRPSKARA